MLADRTGVGVRIILEEAATAVVDILKWTVLDCLPVGHAVVLGSLARGRGKHVRVHLMINYIIG